MKKIFFLVLTTFTLGLTASAQKGTTEGPAKMGYVNVQDLLGAMPEYKAANDTLAKFDKGLQSDYQALMSEYEKKGAELQKDEKTLSQTILELKYKEIQAIQQQLEEFQATYQQKVQKKENELLNPLLEKIQKAIDSVGKESNFSYIYNQTTLLYAKDTENVTPLVKAKLGIK